MFKRLLDIVIGLTFLTFGLPLYLLISLAVVATSPGPVFYRAKRVGLEGRIITLYKFRSMVIGADKLGPGVTTNGDARVTPVGRILRRTKFDELPQLYNVLVGDMSLVGPRPEDPRYVALYTEAQRKVLSVRPGITSPASVKFRNEEAILKGEDSERFYREHIMPAKLAIDLEYVNRVSVITDFRVIMSTAVALFR